MSKKNFDTLGVKMKAIEHRFRREINPDDYVILRLDGKAFHTFTKGMTRPHDARLQECMNRTMLKLCESIQGVRLAYTQSDEISLLITAWNDKSIKAGRESQLWMGGVEAKMVSISASIAAAHFNEAAQDLDLPTDKLAYFDSRVFTLHPDDHAEVRKYFKWRRDDCVRNSISMVGQSQFSPKQLHGVRSDKLLSMLSRTGTPWESFPTGFRFGRYAVKESREMSVTRTLPTTGETETVSAIRNYWKIRPWVDEAEVWNKDTLPLQSPTALSKEQREALSLPYRLYPWYDAGHALSAAYGRTLLHWADHMMGYPPDRDPKEWETELRKHGQTLVNYAEDSWDTISEELELTDRAQEAMQWTVDNFRLLWD